MEKKAEEEDQEQAGKVEMDLIREASDQEIHTLNKIKRQMAAAFAKANQHLVNERRSQAQSADQRPGSDAPQALAYEGELFQVNSIAQKQVEFLEANLDWVNKNNRKLAKENAELKRKVIPQLQEEVSDL